MINSDLFDRLIDWLIDWSTLIVWLADRLIDWLACIFVAFRSRESVLRITLVPRDRGWNIEAIWITSPITCLLGKNLWRKNFWKLIANWSMFFGAFFFPQCDQLRERRGQQIEEPLDRRVWARPRCGAQVQGQGLEMGGRRGWQLRRGQFPRARRPGAETSRRSGHYR